MPHSWVPVILFQVRLVFLHCFLPCMIDISRKEIWKL